MSEFTQVLFLLHYFQSGALREVAQQNPLYFQSGALSGKTESPLSESKKAQNIMSIFYIFPKWKLFLF
jgi:hypothetical protein